MNTTTRTAAPARLAVKATTSTGYAPIHGDTRCMRCGQELGSRFGEQAQPLDAQGRQALGELAIGLRARVRPDDRRARRLSRKHERLVRRTGEFRAHHRAIEAMVAKDVALGPQPRGIEIDGEVIRPRAGKRSASAIHARLR